MTSRPPHRSSAVSRCAEDRGAEGIVADLSVRENIILAVQANRGWRRRLGDREAGEIADRFIQLLHIATPSADQAVKNLSGGNQQKVDPGALAGHGPAAAHP